MPTTTQIAHERSLINQSIRAYFETLRSTEVETPVVVASPGMEPNLVPFETRVVRADGEVFPAALITSPEYAMKKLLARGCEKIFTLTKVFRNEEAFGGTHNPEFSLLEWYEQGVDYQVCMDQTEALIKHVAQTLGVQSVVEKPWKRVRVRDLFLEMVGVDLDVAGVSELHKACAQHQIHTTTTDTESDLFYRLFLTCVEPQLKDHVFVYDYPVHQASLSQLTPDKKYGQRFELYMNGLEICNGFTELTDASEQRRRFAEEAEERRVAGKTVHPIDETFLALLPSVRTPTCGNALGIDRLHMILMNRSRIEEVILFPAYDLFVNNK